MSVAAICLPFQSISKEDHRDIVHEHGHFESTYFTRLIVVQRIANMTSGMLSLDSKSSDMYHVDTDFQSIHGTDATTNIDKRTYEFE
jgi:hypothetical protein